MLRSLRQTDSTYKNRTVRHHHAALETPVQFCQLSQMMKNISIKTKVPMEWQNKSKIYLSYEIYHEERTAAGLDRRHRGVDVGLHAVGQQVEGHGAVHHVTRRRWHRRRCRNKASARPGTAAGVKSATRSFSVPARFSRCRSSMKARAWPNRVCSWALKPSTAASSGVAQAGVAALAACSRR